MTDIKWQDPPPARGGPGPGSMIGFVAGLKARPGEWGMYEPDRGHNTGIAGSLKRRFPGLEATSRMRPDGKCDVFARWVGNGEAAS